MHTLPVRCQQDAAVTSTTPNCQTCCIALRTFLRSWMFEAPRHTFH
jgi:collagenase-like PrtC family protease